MLRGIRGATTVERNDRGEILERTVALLRAIVRNNGLTAERIAMAHFTMSPDLDAAFPAEALRKMPGAGWERVPAICSTEVAVPGSLRRAIRVLVLAETAGKARDIRHEYAGGAAALRPDLVSSEGIPSPRKRTRNS
jgi:chorismate mutase